MLPRNYTKWKTAVLNRIRQVKDFVLVRRRQRRRQLTRAVAELPVAAGHLAKVSANLEKEFLATGQVLEELNRQGEKFVGDSEHLICLAVGQAQGKEIIVNGTKVVESPLVFLDQCLAESDRLLRHLRSDHENIAQLLREETSLRGTMAPLKFMQTLFKIESAPLGAEAQMMFTALTQDIENLHSQVCELFDTKFRELERVQNILDEAGAKLALQNETLKNFVNLEKKRIESSLRQLSEELQKNQKRDVRIRGLSRQIAGEIRNIIVGLQFQDIINQKLQHTRAAVKQILERFSTGAGALHWLEQFSRLEAEQLQAVRADLANAETMIRTGIGNIQNCLATADADSLSLQEFERNTTSADGMIQVLLDLIQAVRLQVADMARRSAEIHQLLQPVGNMATGLTKVVIDLSHRIHLIGLNAQVQAAQFSHGAGLEVLSARTSGISVETNAISKSIAANLDQVATGLTGSVRAFEDLHARAMFEQAELSRRGNECEKDLHGLRDAALALVQSIGGLFKQIQTQTARAFAAINYVETADATLAEAQARLKTLGELAARDLINRSPGRSDGLHEVRTGYTMESERKIFDRVLHGKSAAEKSAAPAMDPGVDMEFFESFPTAPEFAASAPPNPVATATAPEAIPPPSVPATDVASEPAPAPKGRWSKPPVAKADFGDNVELF